jgi:hypothetical protein
MDAAPSLSRLLKKDFAAFLTSVLVFVMYMFINVVEMHNFMQVFGVYEFETLTRRSMIYSYMAGYALLVLRILINMFTIFILTLLIRVVVVSVIHIIKGGGEDEVPIPQEVKKSAFQNVLRSNVEWLLGVFTINGFVITFFFVIPVFLFFFLWLYSAMFNKKTMQEDNENEIPLILHTHHNFIVLFITSIMVMSMVALFFVWLFQAPKEIPLRPPAS